MRRLHCTYDELGDMPEWFVRRAALFFSVLDAHKASQRD